MVTPRRREGRQDRWVSRVTDTRRSPYARVHAVSVGAVELLEGFWEERTRANRETALGGLDQRLTEHGVVSNFESGEHQGYWFTDLDLYKWIEAAAWSLAGHPDADLDARLRAVTATVMSAQRADGYLNTAIGPEEQFRRLEWSHELYCAGHLVQAALARSRVSDHDALLDGARRFADLIAAQLGPEDTPVTDAHPGIETALVELYRETREPRYLNAAIALAARVELGGDAVGITGHAVRAGYFAAGLADIALETGDAETIATLDALWISMIEEKAYITGAIGGRWIGESVGRPFELPNEGAYAETCGAVAVVHWAWRMLARTGEARYADQIEVALHNAVLGGVSLAGDEWFYANPLSASDVPETDPWEVNTFAQDMAGPFPLARRPWRDVTCCPPNVTRMLASLPGYCYGQSDEGLWVHLYGASRVRAAGLDVEQRTVFPWEGRVELHVAPAPGADPDVERSLFLRVPSWSSRTVVAVNGAPWSAPPVPGEYLEIRTRWSPDDVVVIDLDVRPTLVACNPRVAENRGSVTLRRGPVVYCLESPDNPDADPLDAAVVVSRVGEISVQHRANLLDGVAVLRVPGRVPTTDWGSLYRPLADSVAPERDETLTAIPYYAWANRGPSAMAVWLRRG